jgi:hypothetical protein
MSVAHRISSLRPAAAQARATSELGERIRRLSIEVRTLAVEHVAQLRHALDQAQLLASEIAAGGEAYPPGVRDLAARIAEDAAAKATTLEAIMARF